MRRGTGRRAYGHLLAASAAALALLGAAAGPAAAAAAASQGAATSSPWVKLWDFHTARSSLGWGGTGTTAGMAGATCSAPGAPKHIPVSWRHGYLRVQVAYQDCWITSPSLTAADIHLSQAPYVVIRVRVRTPKPSDAYSLDIYWVTTANGTWGEAQGVHTMTWNQYVAADDHWHTVAVDVAAHSSAWRGRISALRIDLEQWEQRSFPSHVGANVWDIQYIGLARRQPAAAPAVPVLLKGHLYGDIPGVSIRGVAAGKLPWVVRGSVTLTADRLAAKGTGLLVAQGPEVSGALTPKALVGTTAHIARVVAAVSCAQGGHPVVSAPVALSSSGAFTIDQALAVPRGCAAPIVLIGLPGKAKGTIAAWFASTDFLRQYGAGRAA